MWGNFSDLVGKTITGVEGDESSDVLRFACSDGSEYSMYHSQDCCENVTIEDIAGGKLTDLVGQVVLEAYDTSNENENEWGGDEEWTFYNIRTMTTSLTIRWYGTSNGYYSTSVSFFKDK